MAFLPRAVYLAVSGAAQPDPRWSAHWNLSTGLMRYATLGYSGERVTNIEPGYPFFLAFARTLARENVFLTLLIQTAFDSLGALFLYLLTLRLSGKQTAAWIAAAFYAFYPYLIGQSVSIIEVPVFTPLLIASVYFYLEAVRRANAGSGLAAGLVFGLTLLVRSMIIPALTLSLMTLLFQKKFRAFLAMALTCAAVVLPWMVRSHRVDGTFIPPRSGWNLLQGNCPYADKIIPQYNPDLLDAYVSLLLDRERPDLANAPERETLGREVDEFFKAKAVAFMKENPWRTLKLKLKNVVYLFYPRIVPFQSMNENTRIHFLDGENFRLEGLPRRGLAKELSYSLPYVFILTAAIAGWYQRRKLWREDLVFYWIVFSFILVYSLYWPATRLRVPMDFILMFYAAFALSRFNRAAGGER